MIKKLAIGVTSFGFLFWVASSLPIKNTAHAIAAFSSQKEEKAAVKSFILKSNRIGKFMSSERWILAIDDYSKSPTGKSYSYTSTKLIDYRVNVVKTDSLITPFLGYLTIEYRVQDSRCGDLGENYGYSTHEDALTDRGRCQTGSSFARETKLIFAYQDNKWNFKRAVQVRNDNDLVENELPDFILAHAFGYNHYRSKENSAWEKLID
jgi:hypothetical protein